MDWPHAFYKRHSSGFVNLLAESGITANQLTIFNFFLMFFGAGYFLTQRQNWIALLVLGISCILDYADGDLAKKTNSVSKAGVWLDSNSDMILQNAIMGAIAIGNISNTWLIVWFFLANIMLNMTSLQYNQVFGFDSYRGNDLFRQCMDKKKNLVNKVFKNIIDPTASSSALFIFTIRYWIILGVIFNKLAFIFWCITLITIFRAVFMYIVFTLHLLEYKKFWVLQALAILDNERREFYALRDCQKI